MWRANRGYRFPMAVSGTWYVTKVGGHTPDLVPGEVGINEEALEQNTSIEPGQEVRIRPFEDTPHPVFRRSTYRLVPLVEGMEDGRSLSRNGEIALPLDEGGLSTDEEVILNSTLF